MTIPPISSNRGAPESLKTLTMESSNILVTAAFFKDGQYKVIKNRSTLASGETLQCLASHDEDPEFYWVAAASIVDAIGKPRPRFKFVNRTEHVVNMLLEEHAANTLSRVATAGLKAIKAGKGAAELRTGSGASEKWAPQHMTLPPATWSASAPVSESVKTQAIKSPKIIVTAAFVRDGMHVCGKCDLESYSIIGVGCFQLMEAWGFRFPKGRLAHRQAGLAAANELKACVNSEFNLHSGLQLAQASTKSLKSVGCFRRVRLFAACPSMTRTLVRIGWRPIPLKTQ